MKLKKFDYKLPREERKKKKRIMLILTSVVVCLVITLASSYAYYQSIELQNPYNTKVGEFDSGDIIFAITIDGESSSTFPAKGTEYIVESVTCDKGATGVWNNGTWDVRVIGLLETKTTCNVEFISESGTLAYKVLQQYGGKEAINEAPANTFASGSTATTNIMYKVEDDYGTSYYYRGAKDLLNNNLIFAGFQWKIVRINGDGSIRLIYNGTEEQFNSNGTMNTTGIDTQIGNSQFNANTTNAGFVGYMFRSSSNFFDPQPNTSISAIMRFIDNWYANSMVTKGSDVTEKIADNLFCNDRMLGSTNMNDINYALGARLRGNVVSVWPRLMCAQKNDRFTVSDVNVGNGALTYPVGLITADEVALAGGRNNTNNTSYYLYTNRNFWSMSPIGYYVTYQGSKGAMAYNVDADGKLNDESGVSTTMGVRPVINLRSNTQATGSGSATDPFVVIS